MRMADTCQTRPVDRREGYVPALISDMYSGLAEAYGIYMLLSFFLQYTSLYPLTIPQPQLIHIYCDNAGVITQINSTQVKPQPHDTLCNDYPIFAEINCQVQLLSPYQFTFHHLKGHQDQKKDQPLSIQEWMNINCDACASSMPPPPSDMDLYHHLLLPAGYPHLRIGTLVITQKVQHTLHDIATQQIYFNYLTDKFPGFTTPATNIHWPTIRYSLKKFKSTERRTVSKFIHEWLPLQTRYQVASISQDHHCPSCHQAAETVDHFLACQHPNQVRVWKDLHEQLQ